MPDNQDILSHHTPRRLKLAGVILVVAALAVAAIGLTMRFLAARQTTAWTDEQAVTPVQLITLKAAHGGDFALPGEIQAYATATINAQVSGTVQKWFVDIGAPVKKGQLLAQIDPRSYEAALSQARGQLARDNATLANAKVDLARYQKLGAQNAISAQQLSTQEASVTSQAGLAETDRAAVQAAQINLGYTRILAPFDGIVTSRSIDVGQLVTANTNGATPMFTVTEQNRLRIYVRMPQASSGLLHPGMTARFTVPEYPGRDFTATLAAAADAIIAQSGTELVQMQADNRDHLLKPGSYAEMHFAPPPGAAGVQVPVTALIFRDDGMHVATVGAGGKVALKPIQITTDMGTTVDVGAGLKPGDKVIDNPPDSLRAGDVVRVTNQSDG